MKSTLPQGDTLKDNLIRVFCLIALSFALYFFFVDWQYSLYVEDFKRTQRHEEQSVDQKHKLTIEKLKILAGAIGKRLGSSSNNIQEIQRILKAGVLLSQKGEMPGLQDVFFYKLSPPYAIVTPSLVAPLSVYDPILKAYLKDQKSFVMEDNAMFGILPVYSQQKKLNGLIAIKVPFLDMQKFVGIDQMTTLSFPQVFDERGKQILLKDPLEYSRQIPLSYEAYFRTYTSHFWILVYAVSISSILMFLTGTIVKQRISLLLGYRIGQLDTELNSLTAAHSLQEERVKEFKKVSGAIHQSLNHVKQSYGGHPLSEAHKQTLLTAVTELAEDLSTGLSNHNRESLHLKTILEEIVLPFAKHIQKMNIKVQMTCPPDLTFIGDSLFVKMILMNGMGQALLSMPKKGELSLVATEKKESLQIDMWDNRYALSEVSKRFIKMPFDFLVENEKLQQICLQNKITYECIKSPDGTYHTKIAFPLNPDKIQVLSAASFMQEGSLLIH